MSYFRAGQQVVCVNANDYGLPQYGKASTRLKKNAIYTISQIVVLAGHDYLHLVGLEPHGWHHTRFRPLSENKTDISVFTKLLNTNKVPVDAV